MKPLAQLSFHGQGRRLRRVAEAALAHYELHAPTLTMLSHRHDTIFRVDTSDGAKYVLRVYGPGDLSIAMIESALLWVAAIRHDTDLIVPEPVPTQNGTFITEIACEGIPETRYCSLSHWVEGRFLRKGLTPTTFEQVGTLLATLHRHAEHFVPPPTFVRPHWQWTWVFDDAPIIAQKHGQGLVSAHDLALIAAISDKVRDEMQSLPKTPDYYGLIHGDLQPTNYLFHHGQIRIIDFEDCCWNHYLYDMAHTLGSMIGRPDEAALRAAFSRGYEQLRPLPARYEERLQMFIAIRLIKRLNYLVRTSDNLTHLALAPQWIAFTAQWLRAFLAT